MWQPRRRVCQHWRTPDWTTPSEVRTQFCEATLVDAMGAESPLPVHVTLWNPWVAKAARTGDMGDDEYHSFVCVEPGLAIIPGTAMQLKPGETAHLTQHIHTLARDN